jgi:hypothetical protein
MREKFEILETGGFEPALEAMRFPTQSKSDSGYDENHNFIIGPKDMKLAKGLLSKTETIEDQEIFQGDTHGKFSRSIVAWVKCTGTRAFWSEADTYVVGMAPTSSTSTMYTLKKEYKNGTWREHFHDDTPQRQIDSFDITMKELIEEYGELKLVPINKIKYALPEGHLQTRTRMYSYQTLRRIYLQRHNHRLAEWHTFCDAIKTLPYYDDLISFKQND